MISLGISRATPSDVKAVVTAVLLSTIASSAAAYQIKTTSAGNTVRWPAGAVDFKIDASASARELDAIRAGFEAWSSAAKVDVTFGGTTDREDSGYDPRLGSANENVVRFARTKWEADRATLAVTFTLYESISGKIISSDIIINAVNYRWTTTGEAGAEDLQNTVTHEAGHFIGISHSEVRDATMFPSASHGETEKRTLDADDANAALALYGARTDAASAGLASQPEPAVSAAQPTVPSDEGTPPTDAPSTTPTSDPAAPTTGSDGAAGCGGATIATRVDVVSPLAALFILAAALLFAGRKRFMASREAQYKEVPIDKTQR